MNAVELSVGKWQHPRDRERKGRRLRTGAVHYSSTKYFVEGKIKLWEDSGWGKESANFLGLRSRLTYLGHCI